MTTNAQRAQHAQTALAAFMHETGVDTRTEALRDLLTDLGHYCAAQRIDYLAAVVASVAVWASERRAPDSLGPEPAVTLQVAGYKPRTRPAHR